jgi:hypothetical protein
MAAKEQSKAVFLCPRGRIGAFTLSAQLPNGSILSMAATYGTTKNMTAITNANPAVATLEASHAIIVGDIFEITSGWSLLSGRIARASAVSTNDVTAEGINTASVSRFPAGAGTGTIREILTWQEVAQITGFDSTGGDQQFTQFQYLSEKQQRQLSTVKSPQGFKITIADDPTLAIYSLLQTADDDGLNRAFRLILPSAAPLYYNGQVSFNPNVKVQINNILTVEATVSFTAALTRYAT